MLTELYVEHFVLIDSLRLKFGRGLHVFTGETGAGKSLLLDATRFVLGQRASSGSIQRGADKALVEAVFEVADKPHVISQLAEWDIDVEDDMVIVSRTLYANGRSSCRVNGRNVTVQMLRSLGDALVEMQGQHESQSLLTSRYQRTLLDLFGKHTSLSHATADAYRTWRKRQEDLDQAQLSEGERARQIDILQFQINEIESADITPGEEDEVRAERSRLLAFGKLKGHLDILTAALEDPMYGAVTQLATAEGEIDEVIRQVPEAEEIRTLLQNARVNTEEAAFTLSKVASKMEADPDRLEEIENRLVVIRSLTRKYGPTSEEILTHLQNCKQSLRELMDHDALVESLELEVQQHKKRFLELAGKLHKARVRASKTLKDEVQNRLHHLHMNDARFEIKVSADEANTSENGYDEVEFLFSGNPGEPLMSLQKVASGGELSRTLLALKVVVADLEQVDTLIFDEIDAGVSGEAAYRVAKMLRELGRDRQVLCVTHAAQVAAAGHEHFQIVKNMVDGRAKTEVVPLSDVDRRDEVGRLLGAVVSDDTAFKHADALLESFRKDSITHV
ncbi:DNA repair protein RecN [Alicyclobacillus dauci]|uniref:DNA repair protein RecN n=1 Tax=Alicyclobacillus dauci TaxID=1475485 RepID=A0ABY6Z816_9BACL|nr:DNA repair protein RecN [Alicyclobacillus dauci]WAH39019.1 DNA repair protein RecN [Alicyclobacillus dauci]